MTSDKQPEWPDYTPAVPGASESLPDAPRDGATNGHAPTDRPPFVYTYRPLDVAGEATAPAAASAVPPPMALGEPGTSPTTTVSSDSTLPVYAPPPPPPATPVRVSEAEPFSGHETVWREQTPPPPGPATATAGTAGGPLGFVRRFWPFLLIVLAKSKYLLVLFKIKAFSTFFTMLVSLAFYAVAFGLPFAAGFIALLFIHEMGHVIVLRRQGVEATAPLFIPFLGAMIGMKSMPKDAYAEAQMALGGPILGSLGALACLGFWQLTGSPLFLALAHVGFLLNLFNLIPVSPLDGGRAMAAISPYGWLAGLALMLLLFLRVHSLFLGFILLLGGSEVYQRWRGRHENATYYMLTSRQRFTVAATYFGLAAVLALSMATLQTHLLTHQPGS